MDTNITSQVKTLFDQATNILVLIRKNPTSDDLASALALFQSFTQAGKITAVACPTPLTVEFSHLFAVDKVETKIGSKNLVISLDYVDGSIEKVSYNVEGDKFNLVIQPKVGFPPFSPEKVKYSYSGINANLLFVVGAVSPEDLDHFFTENKNIFETLPVVNINYRQNSANFGKINILNQKASSCSEIVLDLIRSLSLSLDQDSASNLLSGMETITDNFQLSNVSAETFEMAAYCLRIGAKRQKIKSHQIQSHQIQSHPELVSGSNNNQINQTPIVSEAPVDLTNDQPKKDPKTKAPPDWLQPKIYRGGQLI